MERACCTSEASVAAKIRHPLKLSPNVAAETPTSPIQLSDEQYSMNTWVNGELSEIVR